MFNQQLFMYPQVTGHSEDEDHMCSALVHMCGEVWFDIQLYRLFFMMLQASPAPSKG
jgi:hypothetical protein